MKKLLILFMIFLHIPHIKSMFLYAHRYNNQKMLNKRQVDYLRKFSKQRYHLFKNIKKELLIPDNEWKRELTLMKILRQYNELIWLQKPVDMVVHDKNICQKTMEKIDTVCNELAINNQAIHFVPLIYNKNGTKITFVTDFIGDNEDFETKTGRVQLNFDRFNEFKKYHDNGASWYALSVAATTLIFSHCFIRSHLDFLAKRYTKDEAIQDKIVKKFNTYAKEEAMTLPFVVSKELLHQSLNRPHDISKDSPLYLDFYSKEHLKNIKKEVWD